jgi:hypothetical protein
MEHYKIKNKLTKMSHSNYENSSDTFNDQFLSIAEKIMQSIRLSDTEDTSDNTTPTLYLSKISHNPFPNIKCNNTSTKEIERIIKSVRVRNSHRCDGITTDMLKVSAPYISSPLNYICNKSIRSGTFSSCLKSYSITSIYEGRQGKHC